MKLTDIYIRRPVLASAISLLILVVGLRSMTSLEVRQYPETQDTVVTISTSYPGASSELVKGFITTPLQQAIAEAQGIDYLSSTSTQGSSVIEAHMRLAARNFATSSKKSLWLLKKNDSRRPKRFGSSPLATAAFT